MRTVGSRLAPRLELRPSGELLKRAAAINDALAMLLPRGRTAFVKGVYHYRTLADANRHQDSMLADHMAGSRVENA